MDRTAFILSGLLVGLGIWLLACGKIIQVLLPYIGLLVFHLTGPGSYSADEYKIDLSPYYVLCLICIVAGIVLCRFFYARGIRSNSIQQTSVSDAHGMDE